MTELREPKPDERDKVGDQLQVGNTVLELA